MTREAHGRRVTRTPALVLVALLAIVQGVAGVLRAAQWIQIGSDLAGRGALLLPIIGHLASFRGAVVGVIALLYGLFAWGALAGRSWARPVALVAVIFTALLILGGLLGGAPAAQALIWAIVPVVMVAYLFSPGGRRSLGGGSGS
jgi:hypothetical protein